MDDPRAQRTLVKSPPELWAEISDVEALAGHLGAFGEIRITRLEPETTVAWEGDRARGTVELEPTGWGTKVTLTARIAPEPPRDPEPAAAPDPEGATEPAAEGEEGDEEPPRAAGDPAPEPDAAAAAELEPVTDAEPEPAEPEPVTDDEPERADQEPEPEPARRPGFFARLFGRRRERRVEPPAAARTDAPVAAVPAEEPVAAARAEDPEPVRDAEAAKEPEPAPGQQPEPVSHAEPAGEASPAASAPEANEPGPLDAGRAEAILAGVLDDLGSAHHRPFSRG
jgi:hypothetical protein